MTSPGPAPGWYPNPSGEAGQRYWDGQNWTIVNVPATPAPEVSNGPSTPTGPSGTRILAVMAGIGATVLALAVGCLAYIGSLSSTSSRISTTISSSDGSQPTSTSTLASATAPTAVLPAPTDSVAFVGNPKCGMSHDPSDETGFAAPIGTYLFAEKNYLHKLELDNIDVPDPIVIIKAGYDHVCALVGPSDLDTPNLGAREESAKKELLNSGVVLSADDAQAVVSDAVTELC